MIHRESTLVDAENNCPRVYLIVIFLLSAASLCYEINLTRLFSVTQFYHFAFLIVSLALLGFGASGAFLGLFSQIGRKNIGFTLYSVSFFTAISFLGAYLFTNNFPFESYNFTLGWRHLGLFLLHLVVLTIPFFLSGLSVILLVRKFTLQVNLIYAVNLSGSASGCLIALILPGMISAVGLVVFCTLIALLANIQFLFSRNVHLSLSSKVIVNMIGLISALLLIMCFSDLYLRIIKESSIDFLKLKISPYKGISYALQYPGSEIVYQEWNAYSRVDLVQSNGIRSLPGFSYLADVLPPEQAGLFIDGDDLNAVIQVSEVKNVTKYLPTSIAYFLRPNAKALILEPRGGLEIMIAHSEGAGSIVTAEPNPLVVEAAHTIYDQDFLVNHLESGRSFLRKSHEFYDIIVSSLNSSFHPVRSGAYSLGEDYRYTTEAFEEALLRLKPDGFFVVTRWLQTPPSEFLRAFGIAIKAIENIGGNPIQDIVAFRSYNIGTMLIRRGRFTNDEIQKIRDFTSSRAYDIVYYPGVRKEEVNKYNILPEPYYYLAFTSLLLADSREDWYRIYPYEVTPPTDDKPFFNQYFKWSQLPQVISEFGKVWEPFGGAGYVILLLILLLTVILALCFIFFPTLVSVRTRSFDRTQIGNLGYFAAIGLGYLFIEIPLIQNFILFLDNPSYSLVTVLFSLLFFSGVGSRLSNDISINKAFRWLVIVTLLNLFILKAVMNLVLGSPLIIRILVTIILLAPVGLFMGMPFPKGIKILEYSLEELVPWAWGVNGVFSVVAGVAAALLAISFGFRLVFIIGVILYIAAWLIIKALDIRHQFHSL